MTGDVTDFEICISRKHKNLDILRKKHFFFKLKKIINYTSRVTLWQKKVL